MNTEPITPPAIRSPEWQAEFDRAWQAGFKALSTGAKATVIKDMGGETARRLVRLAVEAANKKAGL